MNALAGKKIILGVTGSISAYKSLILLRLLTKAGAEVRIVMTDSAMDFVGPLSFLHFLAIRYLANSRMDKTGKIMFIWVCGRICF